MTDWAEECEDLPLLDLPVYPEFEEDIIAKTMISPRRLIYKCATCRLEVNGEQQFIKHCQSSGHISKSGRRGFTGLVANQFGVIPKVSDRLITKCNDAGVASNHCACNDCGFLRHRDPPAHFLAADHAYCCSLCRMSKGRQHGGHCEKISKHQSTKKGNGGKGAKGASGSQQTQSQKSSKSFICRECYEEFQTKNLLTKHLKEVHPKQQNNSSSQQQQQQNVLNCCDITFQNDLEYKVHRSQFHNESVHHQQQASQLPPPPPSSDKKDNKNKKQLICKQCAQEFSTYNQLKTHMKKQHPKNQNTPTYTQEEEEGVALSGDVKTISDMIPGLSLQDIHNLLNEANGDVNTAIDIVLSRDLSVGLSTQVNNDDHAVDGFVEVKKKNNKKKKNEKCGSIPQAELTKTGLTPKAEDVGGGWQTVLFGESDSLIESGEPSVVFEEEEGDYSSSSIPPPPPSSVGTSNQNKNQNKNKPRRRNKNRGATTA